MVGITFSLPLHIVSFPTTGVAHYSCASNQIYSFSWIATLKRFTENAPIRLAYLESGKPRESSLAVAQGTSPLGAVL